MVKPVGYFNFAKKLEKAIRYLQKRSQHTILFSAEGGIVRLSAEDVFYIEKDRDYLVYHTKQGDLQKRGSMKAVKEELCGLPFEECIAGCLVNLDMVWRIGKEHVYLQDAQLPLSRRMKKSFTQRYVDFIGSGF